MMKPRAKAAAEDVASELEQAIQRILESKSRRKLVVAGPGTGKTTLFKKLLESSAGDKNSRLTLTFITNLKAELPAICRGTQRTFKIWRSLNFSSA